MINVKNVSITTDFHDAFDIVSRRSSFRLVFCMGGGVTRSRVILKVVIKHTNDTTAKIPTVHSHPC